jgi:hypothetical protein
LEKKKQMDHLNRQRKELGYYIERIAKAAYEKQKANFYWWSGYGTPSMKLVSTAKHKQLLP